MFLVTFLPTSKSIGAVHYYVQDDLLTKEQIRYIRDNFCKQIVEGVVEDEYIKNEKAELEFLKYINSLNIDLYIFQAKSTIESKLVLDPFNKNKKSRKEMFESREYFISFPNYNSERNMD